MSLQRFTVSSVCYAGVRVESVSFGYPLDRLSLFDLNYCSPYWSVGLRLYLVTPILYLWLL